MIVKKAPWRLKGEAFVMVYKFSKDFVKENSFADAYQINNFDGGLGTIMCVNYAESDVGPYYELLFIPGTINLKKLNFNEIKSGFTISKIYVSTEASVQNGINNWAIPKEVADFQWIVLPDSKVQMIVTKNGFEFFNATFKKRSLKLPITTSFIPLKIIEKKDEKYFLTKPTAKGNGGLAKLENIKIDEKYFPDVKSIKPLVTSHISSMEMVFPIPVIE
jgi:hypothetical protein